MSWLSYFKNILKVLQYMFTFWFLTIQLLWLLKILYLRLINDVSGIYIDGTSIIIPWISCWRKLRKYIFNRINFYLIVLFSLVLNLVYLLLENVYYFFALMLKYFQTLYAPNYYIIPNQIVYHYPCCGHSYHHHLKLMLQNIKALYLYEYFFP